MRILKTLTIIVLYELSKALTYEIVVRKQQKQMKKQPKDYYEDSHDELR